MSDDADSTTRSFSVPRAQSLALRPGNALVARGLQDIARFGNRARAKELATLGLICHYELEYEQAIEYYTEAIRLDPKYASAYFHRGYAYGMIGDYNRAIADYTEAIRLDPIFALAYFYRAIVYGMIGDYNRAIADYTEAIRLDPKYARAYHNRGNAYLKKGDRANAESDFAEAKRLGCKP